MARTKKRGMLYSVAFMVLLTAVSSLLLAFLNEVTRPTIQEIEADAKVTAILKSAGIDPQGQDVQQIFQEKMKSEKKGEEEIFAYYENDTLQGYVFPYLGGALWGSVEGYIGVDAEMKKILGVSITKNNETPGLGGRITEDWFQEQFRGIDIEPGDFLIYRPNPGGNVDAITGATQTSDSMRNIYNKEIQRFIKGMKGGQ